MSAGERSGGMRGAELPAGASVLQAVSGGDINRAYKVRLADGRLAFVKSRPDAGAGEFAQEARALGWLAQARALPLPEVLSVGERHLALQWIDQGSLAAAGWARLGAGLAELHAAGAPCFGDPFADAGPEATGERAAAGSRREAAPAPESARGAARFGSLELPNEPMPDWPDFYLQRRLQPLQTMALCKGAIGAGCARSLERVCERITELAGAPEPPARLHGDLWQGNVLADRHGMPWLVDPSAYGGHREVDLAMLHLFGRPDPLMLAAYSERWPLAEGWRERMALWQLAPLLVHALLFGGSYAAAVERTARSLLA